MKTKIALLLVALTCSVSAQSNTAAGAAIGAVAGAAIGANNRAPVAGAVTGAIVGGLVGNAVDQNQQYRQQTATPPPPPPPAVVVERPSSPSPTVVYTYGPSDVYGRPTYVIVQTWNGTAWVQQTYTYNYFLDWHDRYYGPRFGVGVRVGFGRGPSHGPRHHW